MGTCDKPVEKVIVNYHAAGGSAFDHSKFVMVEGMPEFVKGEIYSGMIGSFAAGFGNAIDTSEPTVSQTVGKNDKVEWAGVEFRFYPGASSGFPAASILIGGEVYYLHFTPAAGMHMGPLQITGRPAVDAYLAEIEHAKASGAATFIGGHGMGTADINAVDFQIGYLKKMKALLGTQISADGLVAAMKAAYPGIVAEDDLSAVAVNLYK